MMGLDTDPDTGRTAARAVTRPSEQEAMFEADLAVKVATVNRLYHSTAKQVRAPQRSTHEKSSLPSTFNDAAKQDKAAEEQMQTTHAITVSHPLKLKRKVSR